MALCDLGQSGQPPGHSCQQDGLPALAPHLQAPTCLPAWKLREQRDEAEGESPGAGRVLSLGWRVRRVRERDASQGRRGNRFSSWPQPRALGPRGTVTGPEQSREPSWRV